MRDPAEGGRLMRRARVLGALLLVAGLLHGCATSGPGMMSGGRVGDAPHVRCVDRVTPGETTRPLFFLFCIQSP